MFFEASQRLAEKDITTLYDQMVSGYIILEINHQAHQLFEKNTTYAPSCHNSKRVPFSILT